ncbi:MAG: hypothetical protein LUG64_03880, partial [Clostridiales bacterium]|nr:hypothetical protein [Clostridiales bacterium]
MRDISFILSAPADFSERLGIPYCITTLGKCNRSDVLNHGNQVCKSNVGVPNVDSYLDSIKAENDAYFIQKNCRGGPWPPAGSAWVS